MDIKRKTCDIRTWKKKHLFLDMSSTNIGTPVPSLYHCVEMRSIEVLTVVSATTAPSSASSATFESLENFSTEL
jgi:hypothetical protein